MREREGEDLDRQESKIRLVPRAEELGAIRQGEEKGHKVDESEQGEPT